MNKTAVDHQPVTNPEEESGLLLPGLDGTNPLGFLAALGLFRLLDRAAADASVRVAWQAYGTTWVPQIVAPRFSQEELLDRLESRLVTEIREHPADYFSRLNVDAESTRRSMIQQLVDSATGANADDARWISAIASDAVPPTGINQLQTVRRDYFYGNLKSVMQRTTREHLDRALFSPWDYADALDNQSLHLDPSEDRRHAHQWNKPSGDPTRKTSGGMLGANRLALEAIPVFTSLPEGDALHTLGFSGQRSTDTRWTWPLWQPAIGLATATSLLARGELQKQQPDAQDRERLHHLGVAAAFRTWRILVGKTPNFTPARQVA